MYQAIPELVACMCILVQVKRHKLRDPLIETSSKPLLVQNLHRVPLIRRRRDADFLKTKRFKSMFKVTDTSFRCKTPSVSLSEISLFEPRLHFPDILYLLHKRTSSYEHWPGGRDCLSFSAFSLSVMTRVYRYLLQRTLNLTLSLFFLIFTAKRRQDQPVQIQLSKRNVYLDHKSDSSDTGRWVSVQFPKTGWCYAFLQVNNFWISKDVSWYMWNLEIVMGKM